MSLNYSELVLGSNSVSCVFSTVSKATAKGVWDHPPEFPTDERLIILALAALIMHAHIIIIPCKINIFGAGCANGRGT